MSMHFPIKKPYSPPSRGPIHTPRNVPPLTVYKKVVYPWGTFHSSAPSNNGPTHSETSSSSTASHMVTFPKLSLLDIKDGRNSHSNAASDLVVDTIANFLQCLVSALSANQNQIISPPAIISLCILIFVLNVMAKVVERKI